MFSKAARSAFLVHFPEFRCDKLDIADFAFLCVVKYREILCLSVWGASSRVQWTRRGSLQRLLNSRSRSRTMTLRRTSVSVVQSSKFGCFYQTFLWFGRLWDSVDVCIQPFLCVLAVPGPVFLFSIAFCCVDPLPTLCVGAFCIDVLYQLWYVRTPYLFSYIFVFVCGICKHAIPRRTCTQGLKTNWVEGFAPPLHSLGVEVQPSTLVYASAVLPPNQRFNSVCKWCCSFSTVEVIV